MLSKINIKYPIYGIGLNESIVEFCGSAHKMYKEKMELFEKLLENNPRPAGYMHINSCAFAFANLLSGRTNTLIVSTKKVHPFG